MKALTAGKIAKQLHISPYMAREWLNLNVEPIDILKYGRGISFVYPKEVRKRFPEIRVYAAERTRNTTKHTPAPKPVEQPPAANEPDMKTIVTALQVQINELARRVA